MLIGKIRRCSGIRTSISADVNTRAKRFHGPHGDHVRLVYVSDGTEDGTKGLTENGIKELQSLLADIRTWDGGIREFLIDTQCDPEIIDRIMADEMKRGL
ncbi:hypothetical protein [Agrobacterium tumefaciens]|uniref:hypothetical protein n=1 Tax=Agrobacterium tumefaciens TaxID=358 RepID=UPI002B1BE51B|nr:hypothetical protein [Agrobacterium tumefaciens]